MKKEKIVISLGGSIIVPNEIDVGFLREFKKLILRHSTKQFIIVPGGGWTARAYMNAAKELGCSDSLERDVLGMESIMLNAKLIRAIFGNKAHSKIVNKKIKTNKPVIVIAGGYKKGTSSDYEAVQAAKIYKSNVILNLTNVDYVYTKNPKKFKNAKPLKKITWKEYFKIIPSKFKSGQHFPFDPVASKKAKNLKKKVVIINGKKLKQVGNFINNKRFIGTEIE